MKIEVSQDGLIAIGIVLMLYAAFYAADNVTWKPGREAMYAGDTACILHDGVKEYLPASAERYSVLCIDGTKISGPIKQRLQGHWKGA